MIAGKQFVRFVLAWVSLIAAQAVAGMLIHLNYTPMPHMLPWLLLANALVVLAIGSAAWHSEWKGWKLGLALFAIPAAITAVNMLEGVLFLTSVKLDWRGTFEITLVGYALAAALWTLIFNNKDSAAQVHEWTFPERNFLQKVGRFALCCAAYVFLYFLAGMTIFPYVRDFYANQHIPSFVQIVLLQFFVRGPIFVLVCLLLLRMFRLPGVSAALAVGLAFTLLSSVTLIVPNPVFPDSVRWVHFCEVTSSNFVFGCVVGWVWGNTQRVAHLAHATA